MVLTDALVLAAVVYAIFRRDAIIEAIDRFRGGGPPSPMHPLPADDSALLRRRSHKAD